MRTSLIALLIILSITAGSVTTDGQTPAGARAGGAAAPGGTPAQAGGTAAQGAAPAQPAAAGRAGRASRGGAPLPMLPAVFDTDRYRIRVSAVATGLANPWGLAFLPDGN